MSQDVVVDAVPGGAGDARVDERGAVSILAKCSTFAGVLSHSASNSASSLCTGTRMRGATSGRCSSGQSRRLDQLPDRNRRVRRMRPLYSLRGAGELRSEHHLIPLVIWQVNGRVRRKRREGLGRAAGPDHRTHPGDRHPEQAEVRCRRRRSSRRSCPRWSGRAGLLRRRRSSSAAWAIAAASSAACRANVLSSGSRAELPP